MAHLDLGQSGTKPGVFAPAGVDRELHRTHNMLVVTAIGSVMIIVVAALFMSLF